MMSAGGATTPGQRPYNEDAYLVRDLSHVSHLLGGVRVFMLASDGMGGHQAGDVASRVAIEVGNAYIDDLVALAAQGPIALDPAQALREIAAEAHEGIVREAAARGAPSMGATFVAVLASDDQGWVAHVGDSRAYVIGEATPRLLTTDHSQVARLVAEGILTEREAANHPQRNIIERALGFDAHEPELSAFKLERWDGIVLCTDGYADVVDAKATSAIAQTAASAADAAELLVQHAQRAGADDNATVALWASDWDQLRQATVVAPRRPATIQVPEAVAAVTAIRESTPAARRSRQRQRLQGWLRIGLAALLVVVAAGVVWLYFDSRSTDLAPPLEPKPKKTKTKEPGVVAPTPTASASSLSPPSSTNLPRLNRNSAQIYGEKGSVTLSQAPVKAQLEPIANIRKSPARDFTYGEPLSLSGVERHTVWCWRYARPRQSNALVDGSRLWYLVSFYDAEGQPRGGWVHASILAGQLPKLPDDPGD